MASLFSLVNRDSSISSGIASPLSGRSHPHTQPSFSISAIRFPACCLVLPAIWRISWLERDCSFNSVKILIQ